MSVKENINALQTRQLELQAVMQSSDAHASKCAKLGLSFKDEYPEDYAAYVAARQEYNENESTLESLISESEREALEIMEE